MSALAFDFSYDEPQARGLREVGTVRITRDVVVPAETPRPRLYAVRGSVVDAPRNPSAALAAAPTLDVILGGAWEALAQGDAPACPVCDAGTMAPCRTAGAGVIGGRCGDCGTTLG